MWAATVLCATVFAASLIACEPELVVGTRTCYTHAAGGTSAGDSRRASDAPVAVPWSTGFENGFCDYQDTGGYCYVNSEATHEITDAPVHTGELAAAYGVTGNDTQDALQSRCVVQGTLPESAYYGAWYYFPNYAENSMGWNLFHFEGWIGTAPTKLWDVSVVSENGELRLFVYDFLRPATYEPTRRLALPIGAWVHIEFFLQRSAEATGRVALYQDGQELIDEPNLVTDSTERGEWFVGNFADGLMPPDSTLYVDDVTIRASR